MKLIIVISRVHVGSSTKSNPFIEHIFFQNHFQINDQSYKNLNKVLRDQPD